jgi:hypothetical protein
MFNSKLLSSLNIKSFLPRAKNVIGASTGAPPAMDVQAHASLSVRSPKRIRQLQATRKSRIITPADFENFHYRAIGQSRNNPGQILEVYSRYCQRLGSTGMDAKVLAKCFIALGHAFSPNSFFSQSDRDIVKSKNKFKFLVADLIDHVESLPQRYLVNVLFACGFLDYKPQRLLDKFFLSLGKIDLKTLNGDASALLMFTLAKLGVNHEISDVVLDQVLLTASQFSLSIALFSFAIRGTYDQRFRLLLGKLKESLKISPPDVLTWTSYYTYASIYSAFVEESISPELIPSDFLGQVHSQWLDILVKAEKPGVSLIAKDFAKLLEENNVEFLMNGSVGGAEDEHHVIFADFLINDTIAILCSPYRISDESGEILWRSRLMKKLGKQVVILSQEWLDLDEEGKFLQMQKILRTVNVQMQTSEPSRFIRNRWSEGKKWQVQDVKDF